MAIKMPAPEDYQKATQELELKGQIDRYNQMIMMGEGSPVLHYNLGVAYLTLQDWKNAQSCFETASKLQPDMMEAFVNLGAVHFQQGRFEHAVKNLKKALKLKNDFMPAHANLGIALMKLGKHEECIVEMKQVIEKEPDHPAALGALAMCHDALGKKDEADRYREQAKNAGVRFNAKSSDS